MPEVGKVESKLGDKLGKKLGENPQILITLLKENSSMTTKGIAETLNISTTAVDRHIAKLKKAKMLERTGPARGGKWKVLKTE